MTRKEAIRQTHQADTLRALGFTSEEAEALRRISMRLHRWYERECGDGNGCIERDDDDPHKVYWHHANSGKRYSIRDLETGAVRRLSAILKARNDRPNVVHCQSDGTLTAGIGPIAYYLQTDPRGAPLYILRPGDVPDGADASGYYNRGICVY